MADKEQDNVLEPVLPGGLVPLANWTLPSASVQHTLRDGVRTAWGFIREAVRGSDSDFEAETDIASLTRFQMRRFAPEPDWSLRATALGQALGEHGGTGAIPIVAPPFSGLGQTLSGLAEQRGWPVIVPPENCCMSAADAAMWWDSQPLDAPCVIPELAHFWLRHRSGLALISELFHRLSGDNGAMVVIGCSSWCWSFWARYVPTLSLNPLTLAPMTADHLERWLSALPGNQVESPLTARLTNTGYQVLPGKENGDQAGTRYSALLKDLAALARGNSGVALAVWQKALRARPDESLETDDETMPTASTLGERHCWVVPLEQLTLPALASGTSRSTTAVVHALLLHDRLQVPQLARSTGLSVTDVRMILAGLARNDVVVANDDGWRVTALAYPSVRKQLQGEGYPVDGF